MSGRDPMALLVERASLAGPVQLEPAGQVAVPFAGNRGGDGPLTMGQASTLDWITDCDLYTRMIEWPLAIPAGTRLTDIASAMAILIARHESLRTTFPAGEQPVQRVARSGTLLIDVYEISYEPADWSVLTVPLIQLLRSREFDVATDPPLRVAVAAWQGEPRAAVIVYSHMVVDFASMALIDQEFAALIGGAGTRPAGRPAPDQPGPDELTPGELTPDQLDPDQLDPDQGPPTYQPLDQAAEERSGRGVRRAHAALRSWEAHLRVMPQCMYAVPLANAGPAGAESCWLWSRAGALSLPHIAARTGTARQLVIFAALCTMLSWRTGHQECVMPVASSNRYQGQLLRYVGPLAQDCIVSIEAAGSLDTVVHHASAATLRGSRNGLVEIPPLDEVVRQIERDRGIAYARHCVFNDLSVHLGDTDEQEPGPDPAEASRMLGQTRFSALPGPPIEELLLMLLQQVSGELILGGLTRDASLLPAGEIETLLRGVEALLVAAAAADVDLGRLGEITGVWPVDRGPGWMRIDRSWIELAAVGRLLADALPVPAGVFGVRDGAGEPVLTAYLAAADGIASPEQAHEACMRVLTQTDPRGARYTAMAPRWYVICAGSPADPGDERSWARRAVLAQGDGRDPRPA
jgi:hypothetical protein